MPTEHERDLLGTAYPTLFYHVVEPGSVVMMDMGDLRLLYIQLAEDLLAVCPPGRSRDLAMTALEESLMWAIQSLALTGELVDPRLPSTALRQSTLGGTLGSTGDLPAVPGEGDARRTD